MASNTVVTGQLTPERLMDSEALDCTFVEPFPEDLQPECSICLQVLKKPQIVSCCGYSYCLKCIGAIKTHECPLCREKGFKMVPDKRMERLINQRKVYCLLRKHGCEWTGERSKLPDHLRADLGHACEASANACLYFPERCEFCAVLVCRKDMHNHRAKCNLRLAPCYFCRARVAWKDHTVHYRTCSSGPKPCEFCRVYVSKVKMQNHRAECDSRPTPCEFCGTTVSWKYLTAHYEACPSGLGICLNAGCSKRMRTTDLAVHKNECPYTVMECQYRYAGCQEKIYRKDQHSHLENNAKKHAEMLDKSYRSLHKSQTQLTEKFKQAEAKIIEQRIKAVELNVALIQAKQMVPQVGHGCINFLLVSDLVEDAQDECNIRSRFGQYGYVTFVLVLPDSFTSAVVVYDSPGAYHRAIEASRMYGIRLCKEFVQIHPIYSTDPEDPYEFDYDDYY